MKPINIGGQAVIDGVMIVSPKHVCMAVRRKDGEITLVKEEASTFASKHAWARWPVVRGVVNLVVQLKVGYRMLMKSADFAAIDQTGAPEEDMGVMGVVATGLAVVIAL